MEIDGYELISSMFHFNTFNKKIWAWEVIIKVEMLCGNLTHPQAP
jgi:hypothetical protein